MHKMNWFWFYDTSLPIEFNSMLASIWVVVFLLFRGTFIFSKYDKNSLEYHEFERDVYIGWRNGYKEERELLVNSDLFDLLDEEIEYYDEMIKQMNLKIIRQDVIIERLQEEAEEKKMKEELERKKSEEEGKKLDEEVPGINSNDQESGKYDNVKST